MNKEQVLEAVKSAIGNGEFADHIIETVKKGLDAPEGKYHQGVIDRLDELKGVETGSAKRDDEHGKTAEASVDEEKAAMIEKAIAAVKALM